jgi:superfamily II DNA or RNA helicase
MFNFKYISAPPGAGKTSYLIDTLAPQISKKFKSVLIIVPTVDSCNQIVERSGNRFQTYYAAKYATS